MNKLPINFLLYVVAAGLAGGSAWQFWEILQLRKNPVKVSKIHQEKFLPRMKAGRERGIDLVRDKYAGAAQPFWETFKLTNFTGKLPPPPPKPVDDNTKPVVETETEKTPIRDLLTIELILAEGGDDMRRSKITVRYKDEVQIEVPAELLPKAGDAGGYAGPGDTGGRAAVPAAGATGSTRPVHHMVVGDFLWKPHDDVQFVGIDAKTPFVGCLFKRKDDKEPTKVYTDALGEQQELLAALEKDFLGKQRRKAKSGAGGAGKGGAANAQRSSIWRDVKKTTIQEDGSVIVSRNDNNYLRQNARQIFNEEVQMRDYSSGTTRGVMVSKIPSRLSSFGAQSGDVLISLNGRPVKNKAQALKVGRDLYKGGTRVFVAEVLRLGQQRTITYHVPD